MTASLRQARSRLANATRFADPKTIAEARADFRREKVLAAIAEHAEHLRPEDWATVQRDVLARWRYAG